MADVKTAVAGLTALAALLVVAAVLALAARAPAGGEDGGERALAVIAPVDATESSTDFPCGTFRTELLGAGAGERITRYACGMRGGEAALQRSDVLGLHLDGGRELRVGRVCWTAVESPIACRWSATPGDAAWPETGLITVASLTRGNDPTADLVVAELPALSLVRIDESHHRRHYLDSRTGEEVYRETVEARREARLPLPPRVLTVAMAGALLVLGLLGWTARRRVLAATGPSPVRHGTIYRGPAPLEASRARPQVHTGSWWTAALLVPLLLALVPAGLAWARPRGERAVPPPGRGLVDGVPTAMAAGAGCLSGMALLEGGRFTGRADDAPSASHANANASKWVGAFCLDRTEVTRADYATCIAQRGCRRSYLMNTVAFCDPETKGREREPVSCLLSVDADYYCRHVGKRLPTDDEWVFAARGREGRRFPWGAEPPDASRLDSTALTVVGSFPLGASPEGVLDLGGNVSEITSGEVRVAGSIVRGGSYLVPRGDEDDEQTLPDHGDPAIGFRCAR